MGMFLAQQLRSRGQGAPCVSISMFIYLLGLSLLLAGCSLQVVGARRLLCTLHGPTYILGSYTAGGVWDYKCSFPATCECRLLCVVPSIGQYQRGVQLRQPHCVTRSRHAPTNTRAQCLQLSNSRSPCSMLLGFRVALVHLLQVPLCRSSHFAEQLQTTAG